MLLCVLQVERLASGLRHEPAFVTAALDVSSSEATQFVSNMLKVDSVPSVLLYPEAARGCLKFLGMLIMCLRSSSSSNRVLLLPCLLGAGVVRAWIGYMRVQSTGGHMCC